MKTRAVAIAIALSLFVAGVSAATIQQIRLSEGRDDPNLITAPVYESPGLSIQFAITSSYDRRAKFVRRTGGRLPATRGPEYDLDQKVDVAALLNEALVSEALSMGLTRAGASEPAWKVTGTIKDVYLESRQVYMGATLFYGYLDVELLLSGPDAATHSKRLRLHNYSGGYNAGIGRRDEAESGAARLLVEGAQEILARLNRDVFKGAPHRDISGRLDRLQKSGVKGNLGDLRMVGLSGLPAAAPALLGLVATEQQESSRAALIDALALLGAQEAVAPLAARYATEDEDPRWYTLKAMDYIGGPEAARVVSTAGLRDEDAGPKRLAGRIAKTP